MYVCMVITWQRIDQAGKVAPNNMYPSRGHLNNRGKKCFPPCPLSRLRIWFCGKGSTVPSRVSLLIHHNTRAEYVELGVEEFDITQWINHES